MQHKRVVIFANGVIPNLQKAYELLLPGDYIIAADGGTRYLDQMGLQPDVLIGDLDSTSPEIVEKLNIAGKLVEKHPAAKDETDLELALFHSLSMNPEKILIVGGSGGRMDHALANVLLLLQPQFEKVDIMLDDGIEQAFIIRDSCAITGKPGDIVSLLPISPIVEGVKTVDLEYPLDYEKLDLGETRGISNVMLRDKAVVTIKSGLLLCIHTRVES